MADIFRASAFLDLPLGAPQGQHIALGIAEMRAFSSRRSACRTINASGFDLGCCDGCCGLIHQLRHERARYTAGTSSAALEALIDRPLR
jgi:hypothetical protein